MKEKPFSGHCYCGAVRFEISGESGWVGHCHCESCRRQTGSVMTSFAGFHPYQVVFSGAMPTRFASKNGVLRSFCGQCGSPVAYERDDSPEVIHMQLGLFDDLERLRPQDHSFYAEKASWLRADEHLPIHDWSGEND